MAQFSVSGRMTAAPTSTLPGISLYAPAGTRLIVREIGIFNTTTTACQVAVRMMTTAGTQGAALDELEWDSNGPSPTGTGVNSHTSTGPTITAGNYRLGTLGAAAGAGIIWTFGGGGLIVPIGTGNGVGILTPTGTGQICDVYFDWDE